MIIKTTVLSEKGSSNMDYRSYFKIEVGDLKMEFLDGEPEDANLNRDFNDVYSIEDAVKKAYEAGKSGEELVFEKIEVDDL